MLSIGFAVNGVLLVVGYWLLIVDCWLFGKSPTEVGAIWGVLGANFILWVCCVAGFVIGKLFPDGAVFHPLFDC